jgi:hypothetical protein
MPTYSELAMQDLEISDGQIIQLLGEALNGNIKILSTQNEQRNILWDQSAMSNRGSMRVTLNFEGGPQLTRSIRVGFITELNRLLREYEPYQDVFMRMPENPTMFWHDSSLYLTEAQLRHVYDVLREEVAELSFLEWHETMFGLRNGSMQIIGVSGNGYWSRFPITELTPRALELYLDYLE